jgi:hypothetical protein
VRGGVQLFSDFQVTSQIFFFFFFIEPSTYRQVALIGATHPGSPLIYLFKVLGSPYLVQPGYQLLGSSELSASVFPVARNTGACYPTPYFSI